MSKTVAREQLVLDTRRTLTIICEMERGLKQRDALREAQKARLLAVRKAARVFAIRESQIRLSDRGVAPNTRLSRLARPWAQIS
jgi:hypothetical protein